MSGLLTLVITASIVKDFDNKNPVSSAGFKIDAKS